MDTEAMEMLLKVIFILHLKWSYRFKLVSVDEAIFVAVKHLESLPDNCAWRPSSDPLYICMNLYTGCFFLLGLPWIWR